MDDEERIRRQNRIAFQYIANYIQTNTPDHPVIYVEKMMDIALHLAVKFYNERRDKGDCELRMSEERKQHLISVMTAVYLMDWLKNDRFARDNLHHYMQENSDHTGNYINAYKKSKEHKVIKQHIAQQSLAENRNYFQRPLEEPRRGYVEEKSFSDLWLAKNAAEGKLLVLDLLLDRKHLFESTNKRDAKNFVLEAYKSYQALYWKLLPRKASNQCDTITETRDYVVSAMMLHEMEYTYRLHATATFAAELYREAERQGVPYQELWDFDKRENAFRALWGRTARSEFDQFTFLLNESGGERIVEYISYDILHSDQEVKALFSEDAGLEIYIQNVILERYMRLYACSIISPSTMPAWREQDFADAKHFFEIKYPVFQIYYQMTGRDHHLLLEEMSPDNRNACCATIKNFLNWLITNTLQHAYNPNTPMREELRKDLKSFRKKARSGTFRSARDNGTREKPQ